MKSIFACFTLSDGKTEVSVNPLNVIYLACPDGTRTTIHFGSSPPIIVQGSRQYVEEKMVME